MNFQMVDELIAAFNELNETADVRAVILSGASGHFCAGGDIGDLQAAANMSKAEQDATVARLDTMLRMVNRSPKVVITKVDGAALGGGIGLVCVSDIAIASTTASFGMPEARIGLVPAIIAPYVIQRIGLTRARLLMLTGVRFDGVSAHEYGLVQEVCPSEILDECVEAILTEVRECSPAALAACKQLIFEASEKSLDELTGVSSAPAEHDAPKCRWSGGDAGVHAEASAKVGEIRYSDKVQIEQLTGKG